MGLSAKNMYVVPNNIVGQWKSIFSVMYPSARLLCVDPKTFTPDKREAVLARIRDEDFDGVIIAYSCFEQIPLSKDYYIEELKEKKSLVSDLAARKDKATSKLKKKKKAIEEALSELVLAADDDTVCFDELGITRLFVDEAHNFKNVPFETKADKVLGISGGGSKKCRDMMDKVHMVQKKNGGGGVVLATGTPITNSITDAYIMQQYLQSGELAMLDLQSFDAWIGMFAERSTEFEIDVDTSSYRLATRFAKFHNLPELTSLLASIADFHQVDASAGIPMHDGHKDALVSRTPAFAAYLRDISQRADDVRSGRVSRKEDNMLKITADGRKAALDLRLVLPHAPFTYQSKVARCAENAADIYLRSAQTKATQLIFCDTSTPKDGFNIYDELKTALLNLGVPEEQIAYIHDAETEAERAQLFAKVRSGDIRILIGSTFKLGLGVNIQDRLLALHHIDVPWRPADMTQREGRILRRGNANPQVYIYRYITEGSFDAYSWQLLETKQRFISALLSGSLTARSGADIENTVLDYAEVKALAVGNPLVKKRVEAANELTRYLTLQRKLVDARMRMEKERLELPGKIEHQQNLIAKCEEDLAAYRAWQRENPPVTDIRLKKAEAKKRKSLRSCINAAVTDYTFETREKTLLRYRGFDIVLPANMTQEKPYVWLSRRGKYYVELGGTEIGNLVRIDNYLDTLDSHLEKLESGLSGLIEKKIALQAELAKNEDYSAQIEQYSAEVERLDKELGVDQR